jgi:hypothetical protein
MIDTTDRQCAQPDRSLVQIAGEASKYLEQAFPSMAHGPRSESYPSQTRRYFLGIGINTIPVK